MDQNQKQNQGTGEQGDKDPSLRSGSALLHSEFGLFFLDLSEEARDSLLAGQNPLWKKASFPAGATIFSEGDDSTDLYLVLSGTVEVVKKVGEGGATGDGHSGSKVLAVLNKGSIFGEGALLSSLPRSASARAKGDARGEHDEVEVLMLERDAFKAFVKEKPAQANFLLLGLLRVINQRLMWTNEELVTLYDVAQVVSEFKDDVEGMVERLTEKVKGVTKAGKAEIVLESGKGEEGERVVREGGRLSIGIFDLSGTRLGSMILEKESAAEWRLEQEKVAEVIADHLGIALADHHFLQAEKDRSKLKRESVQF